MTNGLYDESFKISSDWTWFVDSIIINQAKVKYVDLNIGIYNLDGISSTNYLLGERERLNHIENKFGNKVLQDYIYYNKIKNEYGYLINNKYISYILHYVNSFLRKIDTKK